MFFRLKPCVIYENVTLQIIVGPILILFPPDLLYLYLSSFMAYGFTRSPLKD